MVTCWMKSVANPVALSERLTLKVTGVIHNPHCSMRASRELGMWMEPGKADWYLDRDFLMGHERHMTVFPAAEACPRWGPSRKRGHLAS